MDYIEVYEYKLLKEYYDKQDKEEDLEDSEDSEDEEELSYEDQKKENKCFYEGY